MSKALPQFKTVPAGQVNGEDIRCPLCNGDSLVLEGFAQRPYSVTIKGGITSNEYLTEEPWRHDVRLIHCQNPQCREIHEVISQQLWDAMQAITRGTRPC
jgi:hypothetical protein